MKPDRLISSAQVQELTDEILDTITERANVALDSIISEDVSEDELEELTLWLTGKVVDELKKEL